VNQIKLFVFSPAFGGGPEDKKFSAGSIGQVKLKLDTPERPFPFRVNPI